MITESGLSDKVEIKVKRGESRIVAALIKDTSVSSVMLLSEKTLDINWSRPEEDIAWASLQ